MFAFCSLNCQNEHGKASPVSMLDGDDALRASVGFNRALNAPVGFVTDFSWMLLSMYFQGRPTEELSVSLAYLYF